MNNDTDYDDGNDVNSPDDQFDGYSGGKRPTSPEPQQNPITNMDNDTDYDVANDVNSPQDQSDGAKRPASPEQQQNRNNPTPCDVHVHVEDLVSPTPTHNDVPAPIMTASFPSPDFLLKNNRLQSE